MPSRAFLVEPSGSRRRHALSAGVDSVRPVTTGGVMRRSHGEPPREPAASIPRRPARNGAAAGDAARRRTLRRRTGGRQGAPRANARRRAKSHCVADHVRPGPTGGSPQEKIPATPVRSLAPAADGPDSSPTCAKSFVARGSACGFCAPAFQRHVADTPAAIILQPKCAVRDCLRWDALGMRAQSFAANGHSFCDFL